MPDLLIVTELKAKNGLEEDNVQNTWAASIPSAQFDTNAEKELVANAFLGFFLNTHAGAGATVYSWLSPAISRTAPPECRIYDITGKTGLDPVTLRPAAHGSPVFVDIADAPLGTAPGAGLPSEVAACLTLRGTAWETMPVETPDSGDIGTEVDRPKQRHSGRVFLGPLQTAAMTTDGPSGQCRINANFRQDVLSAADGLAAELRSIGGQWCIWSRRDAFLYTVTHAQMDDAFDTIRSRGIAASVRDTFDVSS